MRNLSEPPPDCAALLLQPKGQIEINASFVALTQELVHSEMEAIIRAHLLETAAITLTACARVVCLCACECGHLHVRQAQHEVKNFERIFRIVSG